MKKLKTFESFLIKEQLILKVIKNPELSHNTENDIYMRVIPNKTADDYFNIDLEYDIAFEKYISYKYNMKFSFVFNSYVDELNKYITVSFNRQQIILNDQQFKEITNDLYNYIIDPELWYTTNKYNL